MPTPIWVPYRGVPPFFDDIIIKSNNSNIYNYDFLNHSQDLKLPNLKTIPEVSTEKENFDCVINLKNKEDKIKEKIDSQLIDNNLSPFDKKN